MICVKEGDGTVALSILPELGDVPSESRTVIVSETACTEAIACHCGSIKQVLPPR
jgi:hypothetical protein